RRQPKVEHLERAIDAHFDVGGFEISVDNASVVGGFQPVSELTRKPEALVERQSAPAAGAAISSDPIVERFTIDQLHDESGGGSRLFDPEQRGNVGMNERCKCKRFPFEGGKAL